MAYETTLLFFGLILILTGIFGKVDIKEVKLGTNNVIIRILVFLMGVMLIMLSLNPHGITSTLISGLKRSIRIINVDYGIPNLRCDATDFFKKYCEGQSKCKVPVNNAMCGDPAVGSKKEAHIYFFCGLSQKDPLIVPAESYVTISCRDNIFSYAPHPTSTEPN